MKTYFVGEWWDRRRRSRQYRRTNARCYRCGFLGAYYRPHGQRSIPADELAEIATSVRSHWEGELKRLRREGRIFHEYDPRQAQELGLDQAASFGVSCALGQAQAAGSSWFIGKDDLFRAPGMLVEDPDRPFIRHGLGAAVGKVQNDLWRLVRPHDCQEFVPHQPGLSPASHRQISELPTKEPIGRFLDSPFARLLAWLAGLGGLVWLVKLIRSLLA